ncbi:capsule biosynthesis protein [Legionella maceachernii]|uniref:Capsule biosynthesis protein n=2 Tax=Legionella maceachernii TaxID=466 RepID=A0A0W0WGU4_9GAMM|nr:capsule biosynthesis protein [Legionella maceachernii]SKA11641.1 poly-gamma-glutamate synthesis protein (capsule biosynthesis protein) [Legionella maceachernii]SUO99623.1 Bacterial capsule synthesis protein PGA_cap [Legionella maceachernii]
MRWLIALLGLFILPPAFAEEVHIIAVGDVLLHPPLQIKGLEKGFNKLWAPIIPLLEKADLTYGNLEGPTAEMLDMRGKPTESAKRAYTAYPMFNYPPTLISALKSSGFDIVSTANNHTLDRLSVGIDKTITGLEANQLAFTGTRRQNSDDPWYSETRTRDISIAWLACTQDTNGIADSYNQVLHCYRDKQQVLQLVSELAKTHDAVIVTPHWGIEYQTKPNQLQRKFAQELAEAGALAILGSHPHCVQPFSWITTNTGRKVFVAYSLGNFVSNQGSLKNRSSGLLSLYLAKENGLIFINKISYQPTYMENRGGQMQLNRVTSKKHPAYLWLKSVIGEQYLDLK